MKSGTPRKTLTIAQKIAVIGFMQGRIRDTPFARLAFDEEISAKLRVLRERKGSRDEDSLLNEVLATIREWGKSDLSIEFDEFAHLLREAADLAHEDGIAMPCCLELAEVIKTQDELEPLCAKANAELGTWLIVLRAKAAKSQEKKKGGKRPDPDRQMAIEIIQQHPSLKTAQHRQLLEQKGLYFQDTEIHKLRHEAKNLPK